MSTKIFLAAIAALLIGIGALGYRLSKANSRAVEAANLAQEYKGSLDRNEATLAALRKSAAARQKTLESRARVAEAQAASTKKDNDALRKALDDHREWSDTPLPDSVRDSLTR